MDSALLAATVERLARLAAAQARRDGHCTELILMLDAQGGDAGVIVPSTNPDFSGNESILTIGAPLSADNAPLLRAWIATCPEVTHLIHQCFVPDDAEGSGTVLVTAVGPGGPVARAVTLSGTLLSDLLATDAYAGGLVYWLTRLLPAPTEESESHSA